MADETDHRLLPSRQFVPICAIGASAGGVPALQNLFRQLRPDLGLAYVIILHLAPDYPSALAEILAACTTMPVFEVTDGPPLRRDCVFVIPPDRELVVDGDSVAARPFTEPRGRRAPVDLFFRSIATARGDGIAVVLSGAGSDGAIGVRAIKEAGGVVMVQEPADAAFGSMPQSAIATGAADFVVPVEQLAERIREVAHSKDAVRSLDMDEAANDLRRIVAFLRTRTGHDFASYKRATVMRRVMRRMQVCRLDTLSDYADHLYGSPAEAKELFGDLLISVTTFFRDPRAFAALHRHAVQPIFDGLDPDSDEGIRAWVVGCATGEEAYSIGMLLLEELHARKMFAPIQIFATDLDEGALATAREGRYPRTIEAYVTEERLARFFVDEGTHYRVRKDLRELVLFASHSVLKEPPFMRLDLISCRNLLIYMERSLQQQVATLFHYGLKPGRYLFLGSAETTDGSAELFAPLDRDARLYMARPKSLHTLPLLPQFAAPDRAAGTGPVAVVPLRPDQTGLAVAVHMASLERSAPPSVLVDDGYNIVNLSPTAGRFLLHSGGPPSNVLPIVVRPELRLDLQFALTRAVDQRQPTLTQATEVAFDGEVRRVAMQVLPSMRDDRMGAQALVLFLDAGVVSEEERQIARLDAQTGDVRRLHAELKIGHEALVASRLAHEASIQELRAANEELQSINEEYRSTAEELETSKEELQSINEELHAVNADMKGKLESISVAHNDLQNLTAANEVGTLFLAGDLRIRIFTPPVADIFNITTGDTGRLITDFTHRLRYNGLVDDIREVLSGSAPLEREVMSQDGLWYVTRLRPYRTVDNRIDGVVVTFVDVSARLEAENELSRSEQQLRTLVHASSQVMYRMNADWTEMRELFGGGVLANTDEPSGDWLGTYIPADERDRVRAAIRQAVDTRSIFDLEHRVLRSDGGVGWVHSRAVGTFDEDGRVTEWLGSANDVTTRNRAETALRHSEERMRVLIEGMPQFVWRAGADGGWTWSSPQWTTYTGLSEGTSHGDGWIGALHPDDRGRARNALVAAMVGGAFDMEVRIRNGATGVHRWFRSRAVPVRGEHGTVVEWLGTSTDVDDLRRLQQRQNVLVAELQHRTRNLLGVVRATADTTLKSSRDLDGFAVEFRDRLGALARVQGLLARLGEGTRVAFDDLLRSELSAVGAPKDEHGRVTLDGPPGVELRSRSVQTLALALHELATNAAKYGAFKQPTGRLAVRWRLERPDGSPEPWLHVEWHESGVAMPAEGGVAQGGGAGRNLIEQALPYELGAKTSFVMAPDGVRCSISLPASGRPMASDDG